MADLRITIIGAGGTIGSRIAAEAAARGHDVHRPASTDIDVTDAASLAAGIDGADVVVSAIGPGFGKRPPDVLARGARALLEAIPQAGSPRLVVVGGAGSLRTATGDLLFDTDAFPAAWHEVAKAHADALDVYRGHDGDVTWSYISPAALIEPGERTGTFRIGGDDLLVDGDGNSRITAEDFAIAIVDEAESAAHAGRRIGVAY